MIKSQWDYIRKSKPEESTILNTEVKTAAELGVVERSSEPESIGAECHIWPWRKQQVSVGRTKEDSGICMQVKSRIMSTEMKEAGHYSR